jgi:sugar phosphate permease
VPAENYSSLEERPLSRDQHLWRWKILISTYLAYAGFYLVRKVFTLCKTTLQNEYGIGLDQSAYIWAGYLIAYMVGQFINSYLGRKLGPRVLLLGGLGLSMVCNVVFGFANSFETFFTIMNFNGLVQAAGWPGSVGAVSEWLRQKERGTIMGFWSTNYLVGNIAVKMIGGYLLLNFSATVDEQGNRVADQYGVRYAFLGCTLLAFAIWWLVYFWQRSKPEDVGLEPIVDHDHVAGRAVVASTTQQLSFGEYMKLLLNPIVPLMGLSYFSVKFLRYALDSWLPTFLNLQGMNVERSAYYSTIFDIAGVVGAVTAGLAIDRMFRGRWELVCLIMGLGLIPSFYAVIHYGADPAALAICYGLVGFMLYGPDTLLAGAAAVTVAGQRNGVAVAGLVNGIASFGPVVQEVLLGRTLEGKPPGIVMSIFRAVGLEGVFSHIPLKGTPEFYDFSIRFFNQLGLSMSVLFAVLMLLISLRIVYARHHTRAHAEANSNRPSDAN